MDENAARHQFLIKDNESLEVAQLVHGLSDLKLRAIEFLAAGVRPGVVAKRLEIARETLWRWQQEPRFRRHLQRLRVELHASRIDRTWALVDRSLDVIEEHLNESDLQAATFLLKIAQLDPSAALPDGPEEGDASPPGDAR